MRRIVDMFGSPWRPFLRCALRGGKTKDHCHKSHIKVGHLAFKASNIVALLTLAWLRALKLVSREVLGCTASGSIKECRAWATDQSATLSKVPADSAAETAPLRAIRRSGRGLPQKAYSVPRVSVAWRTELRLSTRKSRARRCV